LLPIDRSDQADRGDCDCYPSCAIHSSIRSIDFFTLRLPGWNWVVPRSAPGVATENSFDAHPASGDPAMHFDGLYKIL
jgi:hypothetical protein